jgi:hypothetical protein
MSDSKPERFKQALRRHTAIVTGGVAPWLGVFTECARSFLLL